MNTQLVDARVKEKKEALIMKANEEGRYNSCLLLEICPNCAGDLKPRWGLFRYFILSRSWVCSECGAIHHYIPMWD